MKLTDLQLKLYEKLKPSGWGDKLKGFLLSQEFTDILTELYNQSQEGKKFTPVIKEIFRAFEECPYNDLKVVIVGREPYPKMNIADGIAFSCSYTREEQPSLRYIFDEIARTVRESLPREEFDPDLKRWSNQGVLMLNTSLTCEINNLGSHTALWKPFINYLFDILNSNNTGIIYVFLGKKAMEWHKYIEKNNYKFFTTYPDAALYRKDNQWDSGNVFNQLNFVLKKVYGNQIVW